MVDPTGSISAPVSVPGSNNFILSDDKQLLKNQHTIALPGMVENEVAYVQIVLV